MAHPTKEQQFKQLDNEDEKKQQRMISNHLATVWFE